MMLDFVTNRLQQLLFACVCVCACDIIYRPGKNLESHTYIYIFIFKNVTTYNFIVVKHKF